MMAKVTITITDCTDGENVNVKLNADPPIKKNEETTQAQRLAFEMISFVVGEHGGEEIDDEE
jgi:hypothetical protein